MQINIVQIIVIVVLAGLAWWANEMLNRIPVLKTVISVIIVVVAVIMLLQSCGMIGGGASISVK